MEKNLRLSKSSHVKLGFKPSFTTALIALLISTTHCVVAQDSQLRPTRIYGTLGTAFVYSNITGSIEQDIKYAPEKFFNTMSIRIGGGYWSSWGNEAYNIFGTLNMLSGKDKNHFELGFGLAYSPGYDDTYGFLPAANLGYRYQKPDGWLFLRAGLGVPESLYVSLGVCL
ncbi:MAG: hypothetical protein PHH30_11995 [Bacteroidales bacterium]|nr:hypothetical protein [Bacteroidales bacterium]